MVSYLQTSYSINNVLKLKMRRLSKSPPRCLYRHCLTMTLGNEHNLMTALFIWIPSLVTIAMCWRGSILSPSPIHILTAASYSEKSLQAHMSNHKRRLSCSRESEAFSKVQLSRLVLDETFRDRRGGDPGLCAFGKSVGTFLLQLRFSVICGSSLPVWFR